MDDTKFRKYVILLLAGINGLLIIIVAMLLVQQNYTIAEKNKIDKRLKSISSKISYLDDKIYDLERDVTALEYDMYFPR